MTEEQFRRLVMALPGVSEGSHMGHPDFRVGGKIFATLQPDKGLAMVRLPSEEQEIFVSARPRVFTPAAGTWGRQGSTMIHLKGARVRDIHDALGLAWLARTSPPHDSGSVSSHRERRNRKP